MSSPVVGDVSALRCKCGQIVIVESLTDHYSLFLLLFMQFHKSDLTVQNSSVAVGKFSGKQLPE